MRVRRIQLDTEHDISFELLDDDDQPIPVVSSFMRHLSARGYSPNTLSAYVYDLLHFMSFLQEQHLTYLEFRPPHALLFLEYSVNCQVGRRRNGLAWCFQRPLLTELLRRVSRRRRSIVPSPPFPPSTNISSSPATSPSARTPFRRCLILL